MHGHAFIWISSTLEVWHEFTGIKMKTNSTEFGGRELTLQ